MLKRFWLLRMPLSKDLMKVPSTCRMSEIMNPRPRSSSTRPPLRHERAAATCVAVTRAEGRPVGIDVCHARIDPAQADVLLPGLHHGMVPVFERIGQILPGSDIDRRGLAAFAVHGLAVGVGCD